MSSPNSARPYLEHRFHQAMLRIHARAKSECDYNPTRFLRMIYRYGGLQTARMPLRSLNPSYWLATLCRCGRLDLSMETLVSSDEFAALFTEEERGYARSQLAGLRYVIPSSTHPGYPRKPNPTYQVES